MKLLVWIGIVLTLLWAGLWLGLKLTIAAIHLLLVGGLVLIGVGLLRGVRAGGP